MKTIIKNSENRLYNDLKALWQTSPHDRCIHLRFSALNIPIDTWLEPLFQIFKTYFENDINTIYITHDADIFITSSTFTNKQIDMFMTHFKNILSSAPLNGLATIHEIGVSWPKLRDICEKKQTDLQISQAKLQKKALEKLNAETTEQALQTLDKELISSLAKRRKMRENIIIMVVEDDLFTQKLVKNSINDQYDLSITGDGKSAVINYINKAPDVLFLDIGLPDINGHDVLKKIFQIDPSAYVVMFSGNGDRDNIMKAIELGAKGFVAKPFTKDKIHQYIDKSPFTQAKFKSNLKGVKS